MGSLFFYLKCINFELKCHFPQILCIGSLFITLCSFLAVFIESCTILLVQGVKRLANFGEMVLQNMHMTTREEKFFIFRVKCFLYDFSKLALFLIFFGYLHKLDYFLFAYAIMLPLRLASGGLHFRQYLSCLSFSFAFFATVVLLLAPVTIPFVWVLTLFAVCAVVIYAIGPIQAPTRPALTDAQITKRKNNALVAMLYATILVIVSYRTHLGSVGYWTIVLQTLQLVIAFLKKKGGECRA